MGKYGSGTSMKTVIESEINEASKILGRSALSEEDKNNLLGILKSMAFNWCDSNAFSCAMQDAAMKLLGADTKEKAAEFSCILTRTILQSGVYERTKAETYPFTD